MKIEWKVSQEESEEDEHLYTFLHGQWKDQDPANG